MCVYLSRDLSDINIKDFTIDIFLRRLKDTEDHFSFFSITEEPVDFVRHLQDQTIKDIPQDVTFECELTKPNVKVQWFKGKEPIGPGRKYEMIMDGAVHRLIIHEGEPSDINEYTCQVRSKTSKAKMLIEGE